MKENLEERIEEIFQNYLKIDSISNTEKERLAEEYLLHFLGSQDYFMKHPKNFGRFAIEKDLHQRAVIWALREGSGSETVILIHHYDVVTVEDFNDLKEYAFSPQELQQKLKAVKDRLTEQVREDLESGDYIFGRGSCDMKAGGAIQLALLERYAQMDDFSGNILLLAVPDEENLSAGMRAAAVLLSQLKSQYRLDYRLMINSEPHQRKDGVEGVFSLGSIGKVMPYVYVRGHLAHAGKNFEGLNPIQIMAEVVKNTEANMDFSDVVNGEIAPPPTWIYMRENKRSYDVSMPLSIGGCLNVLTLNQSPQKVLSRLQTICMDSFWQVIREKNRNYHRFLKMLDRPISDLPWKAQTLSFGELYRQAKRDGGKLFEDGYKEEQDRLEKQIQEGCHTLITANFELVDFVCDSVRDTAPKIVIGLVPPYYPSVSNLFLKNCDQKVQTLYEHLNDFAQQQYDQRYSKEWFFVGISDLSYSCLSDSEEAERLFQSEMPLWGNIYRLPFQSIQAISMPCINIGPWGKDLHKMTERVYRKDLFHRTPDLIDFAINFILKI